MSKKIMDIFSRKYFRDHFFDSTLQMTEDQVANIRLKAVNMMPDLKAALNMSENPELLKKLEDTLTRIKNSESDRDVMSAIESVIPEMAKMGVVFKNDKRVGGFSCRILDDGCLTIYLSAFRVPRPRRIWLMRQRNGRRRTSQVWNHPQTTLHPQTRLSRLTKLHEDTAHPQPPPSRNLLLPL